jgi:3-hydroxyacyl-CoA dehydrogenase/enoyl-CoA hydratase/3-hydroxybutyryl-CoA epimerase
MPLLQTETLAVERDADGSMAIRLDVPDRTHNVITRQVLTDLDAALDAVAREPRVPLLVVRSSKKTGFLAGADVHEFLDVSDAPAAVALSERGQKLFSRLASLPMPSLAAIHGPCLGGGLELALACDYRLVVDRPDTQLGLPEVELGLLPAWGGTQRLPRVVGLERALQMILTGKRLGARQAFAWGLADLLVRTEGELREQFSQLAAHAVLQGKVDRSGLPLRTWRQKLLESNFLGRRVLERIAQRTLQRRVPDDMPAPAEALEAIRVGVKQGMQAGLAREREAVGRLALSPASRHLIGVFLAREEARKLPEALRAIETPEVKRVGVVGAGVMGAGIAQLAALKGCEVVVQEVNDQALGAGMTRIDGLFAKASERGVLSTDEASRRRAAVKGTTTWEGFDPVDLVVEAAVEDLEIKRGLFRELEGRTRPGTVLATNTSSLSVQNLQEGLKDPGRIAGLHFFNPVHKMPLVEVARTPANEDRPVALLARWAAALGKTPVVVRDSPGFVVNRVLMPYLNEAVLLVGEGMHVNDIDRLMRRFGMPMGPLELLDQVGLDVAAHVVDSMAPSLAGRFGANPAFARMRERGWLGVKSGRGFYEHKGKKPKVHAAAEQLLREGSSPAADLPEAARLHEARERMVLLMVNESALALGEGLADAGTIDLAMILGTGWAPHRGGPLHYADSRGLAEVVQVLEGLASRHGKRFEPAAELRRRAEAGEGFFVAR